MASLNETKSKTEWKYFYKMNLLQDNKKLLVAALPFKIKYFSPNSEMSATGKIFIAHTFFLQNPNFPLSK